MTTQTNDQFLMIEYALLSADIADPKDGKLLTFIDKAVYCYIFGWAKTGKECYASVKSMAELLSTSRDSVIRATAKLERLAWITKQHRFDSSVVYWAIDWKKATTPVAPSNTPSSTEQHPQLQDATPPVAPSNSIRLPITSSITSSIKPKQKEDEVVVEETVNVTMHNDTPSSASSLPSASNGDCEPTACEASIHNLQHCINLAVAKCNEHGVKADAGNIERNLLRLGYYKVCKGYEVFDTITYEAPF